MTPSHSDASIRAWAEARVSIDGSSLARGVLRLLDEVETLRSSTAQAPAADDTDEWADLDPEERPRF